MGLTVAGLTEKRSHPLDLVEEAVFARDWACERTGVDQLIAEVSGRWCACHLLFVWSEEIGALHATCAFDVRVPAEKRSAVFELLALTNDRLWVGHFDLSSVDGLPAFRHTLLLRGGLLSAEQVEDLVDIAVSEVDRFYPAFHYVAWGGRSPADAITFTMLDTVGEA